MSPEPLPDIDVKRPSPARVYDYLLGGTDNYAVDRAAAEQVLTVAPESGEMPRANRDFLGRAVRYLADEVGIAQFLDIGSGLPTAGNVHEIARAINPDARVVYVDNDPLAHRHARALLAGSDGVAFINADARDPESILNAPETRRLICLTEPVALLMVSVLHFIADEHDPAGLAGRLLAGAAPGSALAICHVTDEGASPQLLAKIDEVYGSGPAPLRLRSRESIEAMFGGLPLVEPGLVDVQHWRADTATGLNALRLFAGVARVP
jgi:hypothetical protein